MDGLKELEIGQEIAPFSITIGWNTYKKYNKLVHEINPLHFNETYAQQLGYKTIVVAGVFTASFFLRPILNLNKDPLSIIKYHIHYHDPVYIGDTITQRARITKKYEKSGRWFLEFDVWVENQDKNQIISGTVTTRIVP